jgi:hypothetical protein
MLLCLKKIKFQANPAEFCGIDPNIRDSSYSAMCAE